MVIETKRLILRPFLETDAADVYEYLKEPAVNCFASMKLHSLDEAKTEMKKRLSEDGVLLRHHAERRRQGHRRDRRLSGDGRAPRR